MEPRHRGDSRERIKKTASAATLTAKEKLRMAKPSFVILPRMKGKSKMDAREAINSYLADMSHYLLVKDGSVYVGIDERSGSEVARSSDYFAVLEHIYAVEEKKCQIMRKYLA